MWEITKIVNSCGLIIDLFRAILLFLNSPKISFDTYLYNESEEAELQKKANKKHILAKSGIGLLIIGFALQLLSNFLQH